CQPGKPNGQSCSADRDCASHHCDYQNHVCADYCRSDSDCPSSSYCYYTSTCLPKKADGTRCQDNKECLIGRCDPSSDTCRAAPQIGDTCAQSYECYPLGYCSAQRCVKRLPPGASCTTLDSCLEPFL